MPRNYWSRLAFTSALGILLSYAFVFLAVLPLRHLRLTFGRKAFLLTSILGSVGILGAGLWQWALVYASLCVLVGLYRELEEKRVSIFLASSIAIVSTAAINLFALATYTAYQGLELENLLAEKAQPLLLQLQQVPRFKETNLESVLWYLPSALVITLMLVVFVSLTIGQRGSKQMARLKSFSLPDWAIWVFIGSLAATFIPSPEPMTALVGMNLLAVCLASYFFQGLAVFSYFLDRLSIFGFWRLLAYFLVFFQMFLFVSGLGILDYWFDFRSQPSGKKTLKTYS